MKLAFPDDDAGGLATALRRQKGKLFDQVEARVIVDAKATTEEVKKGLTWLRKSVGAADLAVVFFSTHGEPERREKFYFAPYGFDPDAPEDTGFSADGLYDRLKDLPCKKLVILDACFSGEVVQRLGSAKSSDDGVDQVVKDFAEISSHAIAVIGSSTSSERSYEKKEWEHGALALAVIEALTGESQVGTVVEQVNADSNRNGVLWVDELIGYAGSRVRELTGGRQHVVPGPINPEHVFQVAILGRVTKSEASLAGARPKHVRPETLAISLAGLPTPAAESIRTRLRTINSFSKSSSGVTLHRPKQSRLVRSILIFKNSRWKGYAAL